MICRSLGLVRLQGFLRQGEPHVLSASGAGAGRGIDWLQEIQDRLEVPVLTDIHEA